MDGLSWRGRKNKYGITVMEELIKRSRNDFMTSE